MNISFKKYALSILALVSCAQSSTQVKAKTAVSDTVPVLMKALEQAAPSGPVIAACMTLPVIAGLSEMANKFYWQALNESDQATNTVDKTVAAKSRAYWAKFKATINVAIPVAMAISIPAVFYTFVRFSVANHAVYCDMWIAREAARKANAISKLFKYADIY